MNLELPTFKGTEEALRFGETMTRDQYILLSGAQAALHRQFHEEKDLQRKLFIAVKIQLYREAREAAPEIVLASALQSGIGVPPMDQTEHRQDADATTTNFAAGNGAQGEPATAPPGPERSAHETTRSDSSLPHSCKATV